MVGCTYVLLGQAVVEFFSKINKRRVSNKIVVGGFFLEKKAQGCPIIRETRVVIVLTRKYIFLQTYLLSISLLYTFINFDTYLSL